MQKIVGQELCDKVCSSWGDVRLRPPSVLLDLGCGTGFFGERLFSEFNPKQFVFGDISAAMLQCALSRVQGWGLESDSVGSRVTGVQLDAEKLSLAPNSVDLVFSSLALQWAQDLEGALQQIMSALSDNGVLAFSTLLDGTLVELKTSWASVDHRRHVNEFLRFDDHLQIADMLGYSVENAECSDVILSYDKPIQLMKDLKAIGAHNISSARPKSLMGKSKLSSVLAAYEGYRRDDGSVPATYRVGYFILRKTKNV
jgi:malonyl-CoA O-methyltransferase